MALARITNNRFPLNIFFVVTNRCNLDCYYCYGDYYHRKKVREFTFDEVIQILNTLKKMGTVFLQLQGGEPLIREDIGRIITHARSLGFSTDMITNGLLVKKKIDSVKKLNSICISIDGKKNTNDFNRGKDTFEKTLDAIDECLKYGIPTRVNAIITSDTEEEDLLFLLKLSKEKKLLLNFCPSFQFVPLIERNNRHRLKLSSEKHKSFMNIIIEHKNRGYPVQFSARSHKIARDWPLSLDKHKAMIHEVPEYYKYFKCMHGDYVAFIDADGMVYPCCNFWNETGFPNVHESGFEKCWEVLSKKNCAACYIYSYIDRNGLMNFNPKILWNYLNNVFK